jgi:hypothetical protein
MKNLRSFISLVLFGICISNFLVQFKTKEAEIDFLERKITEFLDTLSLKDKDFSDIVLHGDNDNASLDIDNFTFNSETQNDFSWAGDMGDEIISLGGVSELGYKLKFYFEYNISNQAGATFSDSGFVTLTSKAMSLKKSYPDLEEEFNLFMDFLPTLEITLKKFENDPTIKPYITSTLTTDKTTNFIQRIEEFVDEEVKKYFADLNDYQHKLLPSGTHFPFSIDLKLDVKPLITPDGITTFFSPTYSTDLGPIDVPEEDISNFKNFKPEDGMIQLFIHRKFVFDMFSLSRSKTSSHLLQADFPVDISYQRRFYPRVYNFKPRTNPLYVVLQILGTRYDTAKDEGYVLSRFIVVDSTDMDPLLHVDLEHKVTWNISIEDDGINFFFDDKSVKLTKMSILGDSDRIQIDDIYNVVDTTAQKLLVGERFQLFKTNESFAKLINKIDSADVLPNGFILKRRGPKKGVTFLS